MKMLKHFKLITRHKWYVFKNCMKAGLYWQGLTHDLSKYSPVEFFESVKYFTGNRSPIDECKKDKGYSIAWQHHKGRNPHHYEYWVDNFDGGGTPLQMPFKYALELVCDYLAAGQAYSKKNFSYLGEYEWSKLVPDFRLTIIPSLPVYSPFSSSETIISPPEGLDRLK